MKLLEQIKIRLREFAAERDWDQFHSPKNLAMALAGEAGELLGVDLEEAALKKIETNAERYPVDKARGTATKHNEL